LEDKVRGAKIYIEALQDALRFLPKEDPDVPTTLRPGTNLYRVREILKGRNSPMHITDLLKAIGKPADNVNRAALSGSISAYVRKGQIFTRPEPNTFGLVDFTAKAPQNAPPPNFGVDDDDANSSRVPVATGTYSAELTDDDVPF